MSRGSGASKGRLDSDDGERYNLDGSLKNEDLFTLGDDEDEEPEHDTENPGDVVGRGGGSSSRASSPPPAYDLGSTRPQETAEIIFDASSPDEKAVEVVIEASKRHYIQKFETLLGIAFKYKIDVSTVSLPEPKRLRLSAIE